MRKTIEDFSTKLLLKLGGEEGIRYALAKKNLWILRALTGAVLILLWLADASRHYGYVHARQAFLDASLVFAAAIGIWLYRSPFRRVFLILLAAFGLLVAALLAPIYFHH